MVFQCRHFGTYWQNLPGVYRGDLNHTLLNPALLISGAYDPATPFCNGKRLMEEMGKNARLVVHHGYGHTSMLDMSNCTDTIVEVCILNETLPDKQETHCYANAKPYIGSLGQHTRSRTFQF